MPQINRIRVNNVKYNFGTQYYDDFLMRFLCKNTIYDLANGGGKSVLMLLLLQTMLPNCTLDEKQPVEKLFSAGGSTTIHSLVEWKLDSCDVRNGYKYMTCGFCARKGRAGEDEASAGTGIEYFNYCIFYREFGDNDIKNLPLSDGKERITYNGLKAYLRELEKKDLGIKVKLFERKGDYLSFINDYGIYESHWELIRGINKTEGHVRTYFEGNYKTTRKVVEDLLVEEIIEKSYNNRIRGGNGDDEMARTLLEIKDKLLELAKRREDMESYDKEIKLLADFSSKVTDFGNIFARKEEAKNTLFKFLIKARAKVEQKEREAQRLAARLADIKAEELAQEKLIAAALIADEEAELGKVRELVESLSENYRALSKTYEGNRRELELSYAAEDYSDYKKKEKELSELSEYMENRHKDRGDIAVELSWLAAAKHQYMSRELEEAKQKLEGLQKREQESQEALESLEENIRARDNEAAHARGRLAGLKSRTEELESSIKDRLGGTPLLIAENAAAEAARYDELIAGLKVKSKALSEDMAQLGVKKESCIREQARTEAELMVAAENIERLEAELSRAREREKDLSALGRIYGEPNHERLTKVLGRFYDHMLSERELLSKKVNLAREYMDSIESLSPADSEGVQKMCEYLRSRYEGSIIGGAEYLREKGSAECAVLSGRFPYLPYSVLVGDDYEDICRDKHIMAMDCGVIPIIRLEVVEGLLGDEGREVSAQPDGNALYMLACRDMAFIYDEAGRQSGIRKAAEEFDQTALELARLEDRLEVVKGDYERVSGYACMGCEPAAELENRLAREKQSSSSLLERADSLRTLDAALGSREEELAQRRAGLEKELADATGIREKLEEIAQLDRKLDGCRTEIKKAESEMEEALRSKRLSMELHDGRKRAYNELVSRREALEGSMEELKKSWEMYAPYYKQTGKKNETAAENIEAIGAQTVKRMLPAAEIDARFGALRTLLNEELGDIADKERLMESCRTAMEKAQRAMLHRGITLERAGELEGQGLFNAKSSADILTITRAQEKLKQSLQDVQGELDSASAQMNRIEGSCAHARRSYEERYGQLGEVAVENTQEYVRQHRAELERLSGELARTAGLEKENMSAKTSCMLMQKDLERMVKAAAPDAEDIINRMVREHEKTEGSFISFQEGEPDMEELTDSRYEKAGRDFELVIKEEQKKRTAFARAKELLIDQLTLLKAYELAQEVKQNVQAPQTQGEADELFDALKGTMDCIALERDRISRGIEDMELIKSNFENRCVQICTNIRSELERLDRLSRITLDDEVIPVLSLHIPYIKEEMYKDRMSVYINETVSTAESFKTMEERLRYIRGRLSWKRLFSVIVTDMNSISLKLYKRERIKDQSRYLRYEEAVGSTGQSQGIYIQFLVAVINYIANINAGGKEAAVLGKTIFIDNPFGAAKDVYIWEPIFKLLKTNHVQLIVPARGATPAITGRFDVNYVLGQRMVDKKQQTVVVDYHSQVAQTELEYERLSFSQESFDFL